MKGDFLSGSKLACKLKKSLYGLKQASRQSNFKLTESLLSYRFKQSKSDYSLFTYITTKGDFVALLVYVDDIIIGSASFSASATVKEFLKSKFKLKDLGALRYFLGLKISMSTKVSFSVNANIH